MEEVNLYIETANKERYGQINTIVMKVTKLDEKQENNQVNKVEEIDINISNSNKSKKNEENNQIPEDEINNLKQYLYNTYSVEIEKIHINE